MAAISLAIIGKNNEPLYMREFDEDAGTTEHESEEHLFGLSHAAEEEKVSRSSIGGFDCSIRHQFILHAALDRFEQLSGPPPGLGWRKPGVSGTDGMFVGLLCPVEEMRVYGYVTTTTTKIMVVVEDDDTVPAELQQNVDSNIKSLLVKIHQLYIADLLNPFKEIGSAIVSKRFDERVQKYVAGFNQSDGMI